MSRAISLVTELPGPRSAAILERKARVVATPSTSTHPPSSTGAVGARYRHRRQHDASTSPAAWAASWSATRIPRWSRRCSGRRRGSRTPTSRSSPTRPTWSSPNGCRCHGRSGTARSPCSTPGPRPSRTPSSSREAATGRPAVICFEGGFHGRTLLTMSLTSRPPPVQDRVRPVRPRGLSPAVRVPVPQPRPRPARPGRARTRSSARSSPLSTRQSVAAVDRRADPGRGRIRRPAGRVPSGVESLCRSTASSSSPTRSRPGPGARATFLASEQFGFDPDIVVLRRRWRRAIRFRRSWPGGDHGRARALRDRRDLRGEPGRVRGRERRPPGHRRGGPDRAVESVGKASARGGRRSPATSPEVGEIRGVGAMVGVEFVTDRRDEGAERSVPRPPGPRRDVQTASSPSRAASTTTCFATWSRWSSPDEELEEGLDVLADAALAARSG